MPESCTVMLARILHSNASLDHCLACIIYAISRGGVINWFHVVPKWSNLHSFLVTVFSHQVRLSRQIAIHGVGARVKALEHNFTVPAVPRPRRNVRCISVSPGRLRSLHHPRKEGLGVLAPVSSKKKGRLLVSLLPLLPLQFVQRTTSL